MHCDLEYTFMFFNFSVSFIALSLLKWNVISYIFSLSTPSLFSLAGLRPWVQLQVPSRVPSLQSQGREHQENTGQQHLCPPAAGTRPHQQAEEQPQDITKQDHRSRSGEEAEHWK